MAIYNKTGKSQKFRAIVAKAMRQSCNNNEMGDNSFAEMQAKRDETLSHLYDIVLKASNAGQAQQIVDIVKLGLRGNTFVDAMPIMAVGDVMAYVRNIAFESIKDVRTNRSDKTDGAAIDLDQARAEQHCEDMVNVYWAVQKAYYTLYKRFWIECSNATFKSKAS